ncbi:hypothetical protein FJ938_22345 [Mesorhizobium sp. B2-4-14]|nr:hypothetical protein FJ938_22345 [Mesorhizobium sp. B2-4-14]
MKHRPESEKAAANRGFSLLDSLEETGAGEAIRTLDPNLGKVGVSNFLWFLPNTAHIHVV